MAAESVSCGQQQHFWGLVLSSKSPFPVQEPNTLWISLLERNRLLLPLQDFRPQMKSSTLYLNLIYP